MDADAPQSDQMIKAARLRTDKKPRTVFVAYSYKDHKMDDYRSVYGRIAKALDVSFVFADERITALHILEKIATMIREAQFSVFDISGWNPNVTLELGLAWGFNEKAYIAFNPGKTSAEDVPADLRGLDRLQYESYTELESRLSRVIAREFPPARESNPLGDLETKTVEIIGQSPGVKVSDIAKALGITTNLARFVVAQLVNKNQVESRGATRGTRYYLIGQAPPEPTRSSMVPQIP